MQDFTAIMLRPIIGGLPPPVVPSVQKYVNILHIYYTKSLKRFSSTVDTQPIWNVFSMATTDINRTIYDFGDLRI